MCQEQRTKIVRDTVDFVRLSRSTPFSLLTLACYEAMTPPQIKRLQ